MKKDSRYFLGIVVATSIFLLACGDKKADQQTGGSAGGDAAAAGASLISVALQQGAFLPAELAVPRFAD